VYVRVWTFDGVVAVSVALAAVASPAFRCATALAGRHEGAERGCEQYEPSSCRFVSFSGSH
jgi:hypothetical protein